MAENNPGSGDPLDARRKKHSAVDKTNLEVDAITDKQDSPGSQPSTAPAGDQLDDRRKKPSTVEKTKQEVETVPEAKEVTESNPTTPTPTPPQSAPTSVVADDPMAARRVKAPPVAPTNLDMEAVRDMAAKAKEEQESKIAEELKNRPAEPEQPVKTIDKFRNGTPCDAQWESMEGTGKSRFCNKCHLRVYDFTGMDRVEADEVIFKLENRSDAPLYKRADGRFMTSDCPVAVKSKRGMVIMIAGGIVVVAAVTAIFLMMPHPAPTVTTQPGGETPQTETSATPTTTQPAAKPSSPFSLPTGFSNSSVPVPGSAPAGTPSSFFSPTGSYQAPADSGYVQGPPSGAGGMEPPGIPSAGDMNSTQTPGTAEPAAQAPQAPATQAPAAQTPAAKPDLGPGVDFANPSTYNNGPSSAPPPEQTQPPASSPPAENPYVKTYH